MQKNTKGKYIYEFYAKSEHEKDGKYIQHYPGYLAARHIKMDYAHLVVLKQIWIRDE